jgi:hypothetical protein
MTLAVNRTGVIFKKCDMSNHRPETVKQRQWHLSAYVPVRHHEKVQARLDVALLGQRQAT